MDEKRDLRATMRKLRRDHVAALPDATRALVFLRPPACLLPRAPEGSIVGLYFAQGSEAATRGYARWFFENRRKIALPWFAAADAPMQFREWTDPFEDSDLVNGPFGPQPVDANRETDPSLVFVPLLGFTTDCARLGQGGGHYDRWLDAHPEALAVGLGWDSQLLDDVPREPHDVMLRAVITPTRIWGSLA